MKCVHSPNTPFQTLTLAASGTVVSNPIDVRNADCIGLNLVYAGSSPTGTITIQCSGDGGATWADMSFTVGGSVVTEFDIPSSASPIYIDLSNTSIQFLQVTYVAASGTGTLAIWTPYRRVGD